MRKVIDSNYLQDERLHKFLSASQHNRAVLTDYAAMEAYKGDTLKSIPKSMGILAQYSRQVIILKSTLVVCGLRGRRAGLQRRLIDERQTEGFGKYCQAVKAAMRGNTRIQKQLLSMGEEATEHLNRVRDEVASMSEAVNEIAENFSNEELTMLRKGQPFTSDFIRKSLIIIIEIERALFENHPRATNRPNMKELPNTFLFRYALCSYLQMLRWIAEGGPHSAKPEKLRNDVVDLNMAAFATYFDGVLSADKKLLSIYDGASFILAEIALPG